MLYFFGVTFLDLYIVPNKIMYVAFSQGHKADNNMNYKA